MSSHPLGWRPRSILVLHASGLCFGLAYNHKDALFQSFKLCPTPYCRLLLAHELRRLFAFPWMQIAVWDDSQATIRTYRCRGRSGGGDEVRQRRTDWGLFLLHREGIRFTRLSDGMTQRRIPRATLSRPWRNTGAYTADNALSDRCLHLLFIFLSAMGREL